MSRTEAEALCLDETDVVVARRRITVEGRVQGVGFRPFVHRLADTLDLTGWVTNGPGCVVVKVQGDSSAIAKVPFACVVAHEKTRRWTAVTVKP